MGSFREYFGYMDVFITEVSFKLNAKFLFVDFERSPSPPDSCKNPKSLDEAR